MLDMKEIDAAIAELESTKTNFSNCSKLATLYTVREHAGRADRAYETSYSTAAPPETRETGRYGDSEFLRAVENKDMGSAWKVMDELMDTLQVVNKRVYDNVLKKIERL